MKSSNNLIKWYNHFVSAVCGNKEKWVLGKYIRRAAPIKEKFEKMWDKYITHCPRIMMRRQHNIISTKSPKILYLNIEDRVIRMMLWKEIFLGSLKEKLCCENAGFLRHCSPSSSVWTILYGILKTSYQNYVALD